MEYIVANTNELHTTINMCSSGDTIIVKAGDYSGIQLSGLVFEEGITIKSFDSADPARFLNKTVISNCENVHFENIDFSHTSITGTYPNSPQNALIYIDDSERISVSDCNISGTLSDHTIADQKIYEGYPFGVGINITNSNQIDISSCNLSTLYRGIRLGNNEDVTIEQNHIQGVRVDAISGTDHIGTTIRANLIENSRPYRVDPDNTTGYTDEHSDMIQYWATNAKFGVHNFKILDNIFIQKDYQTQTIFGRENLRGSGDNEIQYFSDFEIAGNLIYNGHANAITISGVDGARIYNNSVIPNELVLVDARQSPAINIRYDGLLPSHENFNIFDVSVQETKNIEIYNNVVSTKNSDVVAIRAYNKNYNNYDDVVRDLNLTIEDNIGIDTREIDESNFREKIMFNFIEDGDINVFLIDERAAEKFEEKGSKFLFDKTHLEDFISNLKTSDENYVTSIIGDDVDISQDELVNSEVENIELVVLESPPLKDDEIEIINTVSYDVDSEQKPTPSYENELVLSDEFYIPLVYSVSFFSGQSRIMGSNLNDLIVGTSGKDKIMGGEGDDYIIAGGGNDGFIKGGGGADTFEFAVGDGLIKIYDFESGKDTINLVGGLNFSDLEGSSFERNGKTTLVYKTAEGDRLMLWNHNEDSVGHTDFRSIEHSILDLSKSYKPSDYDDVINGTGDNDFLLGTSSNDWIIGGDGNDKINGGAGDDYIIAGEGNDGFVRGGSGEDVFQFSQGDHLLKIFDFEAGIDRIALTDGLKFQDLDVSWFESNGVTTTVFKTHDGDRLMFRGQEVDDLSAENFVEVNYDF